MRPARGPRGENIGTPTGSRHVLVLSASMGAGHDGAAKELASRLVDRGHTVTVRDYLPTIPLHLGFFIRWFYAMQLKLAPSSYEWHYKQCERPGGPILRVSLWFANLARRRVLAMVRREDASLIVSTYPLASQVLGRLRKQGRLATPTATFMTDFAPHYLWVHPQVDLHLTVSPATAVETTRMTGRPAVATGPMVPDRFAERISAEQRSALRAELGLADDDVVALVVAGSWGVGDVRTTVERLVAGGLDGRVRCAVVCGRNSELRAEMDTIPGAVGLGWRTDMPQLLQASDVLVENAGGLTAMEAFAVGLPVISHECLPGHGRDNAAAMQAAGVSTWVQHEADLIPTVLAMTGEAGRAQARIASTVFAADPAQVVEALARTGDVPTAIRAAGLTPAAGAALARHSRKARATRRVRIGVTALLTLVVSSTVGVSAATAIGVGVAQGNTDHKDSMYLIVRLAEDDLTSTGQVSPALVADLLATHATVAVDSQLLARHADAVRTLGADGVTLVNAGCGKGSLFDPRSSQRDLVDAKHSLGALPGAQPWVFVSSRHLNVLDWATSTFGDDQLVRPDSTVTLAHPLQVKGGKIVLIDGRSLDARQVRSVLAAAVSGAATQGLHLQPLLSIVPSPS